MIAAAFNLVYPSRNTLGVLGTTTEASKKGEVLKENSYLRRPKQSHYREKDPGLLRLAVRHSQKRHCRLVVVQGP